MTGLAASREFDDRYGVMIFPDLVAEITALRILKSLTDVRWNKAPHLQYFCQIILFQNPQNFLGIQNIMEGRLESKSVQD